ncbi:MAG: hypothetical protein U0R44_04830 [Candidatus Micrarchaeia archaeon]
MRHDKAKADPLMVIAAFTLGMIAMAAVLLIVLLPAVLPYLAGISKAPAPEPAVRQGPSADEALYYSLKNRSCQTLSHDFLIVTEDRAVGSIVGLVPSVPEEIPLAESIAASNDLNQTVRTYVRGQEMKKVVSDKVRNATLIWKDGRLYQCGDRCSMRLLGDAGWQSYLDSLEKMRTGCAYFGRTPMPPQVNMSRLLRITRTGRQEIGGFRCEGFLLAADRSYAEWILANQSLDQDQQAVVWGLARQAAPFFECLDDGNGIIVSRNITLDLSRVYRFGYSPGGGMFVSQQTSLTYFGDSVPESFMGIPG